MGSSKNGSNQTQSQGSQQEVQALVQKYPSWNSPTYNFIPAYERGSSHGDRGMKGTLGHRDNSDLSLPLLQA